MLIYQVFFPAAPVTRYSTVTVIAVTSVITLLLVTSIIGGTFTLYRYFCKGRSQVFAQCACCCIYSQDISILFELNQTKINTTVYIL